MSSKLKKSENIKPYYYSVAPQKKNKIIVTVLLLIACLVGIVGLTVYHFFYDINAINPGEKIAESVSPSGQYTISVYQNDGGATTACAILCVLYDGNKEKNIYWNYPCESAEIVWIDNDTVIINDIQIDNIFLDTYDFRKAVK